ncbi:MAG TPA: archaemetzincin [Pirellulales bacterium]|nr:archaemetzincin [Pirellulales bacterium]
MKAEVGVAVTNRPLKRNWRHHTDSWLLVLAAGICGAPLLLAADPAVLPLHLRRLVPLHKPLGKPQPGDWLDKHDERGQTYRQYLAGKPIRATTQRKTISIQPLGDFTAPQRKIIDLATKFERIFFQLPVRVQPDLPLSVIAERARRVHPEWQVPQVLSTYVLNDVLKPRLPADAVVSIALTNSDLWPGEGWNFVFGQASLGDRVGVWSIHRFGDPAESDEAFRITLRRALRTAVHETGHMFSMAHCTDYECVMNGSNNLPEADRQPLALCPICLAKLCHATAADPQKRFEELAGFAQEHGLIEEEKFWRQSLEALRGG